MRKNHHTFARCTGRFWLQAQLVDRRTVRPIAQRARCQFAITGHGVDSLGHCHAAVQHPAHWPLIAARLAAIGVGRAKSGLCQMGTARHQRGLDQTLKVNHGVVVFQLQALKKSAPLLTRRTAPAGFAPAPLGNRQHLAHALNPFNQRRKGLFHHPVNLRLRPGAQHVLHHRHGLNHVAQRRQFDQQDLH